MRFKIVHGAAAIVLAASAARGDSMCVVKHENSGMLYEAPCDNLPLHKRDEGEGSGGNVEESSAVVFESATVVVVATITAQGMSLVDESGFSTLRGAYTTISKADVTATLPVNPLSTASFTRTHEDGSKETLIALQPADQTAPIGEYLKLLYGCKVAENDFIICPFAGRNPPSEMFPTTTAAAFVVQRDFPVLPEVASAASALSSMVAATNLWPTGVHPFVAPTPTSPAASDCVDSLAEEFAMNVRYDEPLPAGFVDNKAVSDLGISLVNGTLIDSQGRLGSIVANRQLQFDAYGQAGSIYTAGFQACGPPNNRHLALGGSTVWWGCVSGAFMNLYDSNIAPQCVALQLSLLNNQNPGADLDAAAGPTDAGVSERVGISTTNFQDDLKPTAVDKRATFNAPSNTWLHTMLLGSTPVSVWAPYPVFTTNGVVWSATKTKLHGTHATYIGAPIATAHPKRNDVYDGFANDAPIFHQGISTVVTVTLAAETIEMAVATGEDDTMETFTVQPSTITLANPAASVSTDEVANNKRDETMIHTVNGTATSTASFVFNPGATSSTTEAVTSVVSQVVTSLVVTQTLTVTVESVNASSSVITATESPFIVLSTVTDMQTATTTHSNDATQIIMISQPPASTETASFVTAGAITTQSSNSTMQVVVLSTLTAPGVALNSTSQSVIASNYNVSTPAATGVANTTTPTTLLSTSTSSEASTTSDAILSGSIGSGPPAATTVALSGAERSKTKFGASYMPLFTAMAVGLTVVFFAERYLGRLHV